MRYILSSHEGAAFAPNVSELSGRGKAERAGAASPVLEMHRCLRFLNGVY